jgi:hypothetical protein
MTTFPVPVTALVVRALDPLVKTGRDAVKGVVMVLEKLAVVALRAARVDAPVTPRVPGMVTAPASVHVSAEVPKTVRDAVYPRAHVVAFMLDAYP